MGILLGGCLTCEELVGVTDRRWWVWFWRVISLYKKINSNFDLVVIERVIG